MLVIPVSRPAASYYPIGYTRLRACGSFQDFPEATEPRVSTGKI